MLTAADQAACEKLAADDNQGVCASQLDAYAMDGVCSVGASAGTTSSFIAPQCVPLNDCCPSLPLASRASCNEIVMQGNGANCASSLTTLMSAGYCVGSTGSGRGTGSGGATGGYVYGR